jgi:putative flippase GtrA
LRFAVAGIGVNAVAYAVFLALIGPVDMAPVAASGATYAFAFALGYVVHRAWTFESVAPQARDLPRYAAAHGVGLTVTVAAMSLLARVMAPWLAQIVVIGVAAASIYATLRLTGFGQGPEGAR